MTSSLRNDGGVAAILEEVRASACESMKERLAEARFELSEEAVETISRWAGTIARTVAADGVSEAFQLGVNKYAQKDDFERPTAKPPPEKT